MSNASDSPSSFKLGFLSLGFIIGDSTYWMTTGLGRDGFYFTVLPVSLFAGYPLIPHRLSTWESEYSEITAYSDRNVFQSQNPDCHLHGPMKIATDLTSWPRLSWNEMAAVAIDAMPLSDQVGLWHDHVVRKTDPSFQINDVAYKVLAFLPPPEHEGFFSILGEDYKLPENPNFITCNLPDDASFKARLRGFRINAINVNGKFYPVL